MASECGRDDVGQARRRWRLDRQPRMREQSHRLVFLDETATTTKMTRLRGRALQGKRLKARAPFGHWKTQTFIAGCLVPGIDGALFSQQWKDALWARFSTGAPARQRQSVEQEGVRYLV